MNDKQSFIDSIKRKLLSKNDLFDEALICFKNGCNRSAYIIAWITIVESLKHKISVFADLGDVNSIKAKEKIENLEKKKLSTDKTITEEAKTCNIVQDSEVSCLNFLWEQRCLFAHPYNARPTDDQVVHILNEAISITLGKDLYFNKEYLDDLCKKIVNHPHFVPSESSLQIDYYKHILTRVPEHLHPYIFKQILKEIAAIELNLSKEKEVLKLRRFLIEIMLKTTIPITDSRFQLEKGITVSPFTCWCGYVHRKTWHKIPDREKGMLFSYMLLEKDVKKSHRMYMIVSKIADVLEANYKNEFQTLLNHSEFDVSMAFKLDINYAFDRMINEMGCGWNQQNRVSSFLMSEPGDHFINDLSSEQMIELGRKLQWAKDQNSFTCRDYVNSIINGYKEVPDSLKAGIAIGHIVPVKSRFELPSKSEISKMVRLLEEITDKDALEKAYEAMNSIIEDLQPIRHERFPEETFTEDTKYISANMTDKKHQNAFNTFISTVKAYMDKTKEFGVNVPTNS